MLSKGVCGSVLIQSFSLSSGRPVGQHVSAPAASLFQAVISTYHSDRPAREDTGTYNPYSGSASSTTPPFNTPLPLHCFPVVYKSLATAERTVSVLLQRPGKSTISTGWQRSNSAPSTAMWSIKRNEENKEINFSSCQRTCEAKTRTFRSITDERRFFSAVKKWLRNSPLSLFILNKGSFLTSEHTIAISCQLQNLLCKLAVNKLCREPCRLCTWSFFLTDHARILLMLQLCAPSPHLAVTYHDLVMIYVCKTPQAIMCQIQHATPSLHIPHNQKPQTPKQAQYVNPRPSERGPRHPNALIKYKHHRNVWSLGSKR